MKKWKEIKCPKGKLTGKNPHRFNNKHNSSDYSVNEKYCRNNCADYKKKDCKVWKK